MSMKLTKADAARAHERLNSLRNRIARVKADAEATTEKVVRTIEVGGTAFAMGVMQGRTGGLEIFGVPAELLIGIGGCVGGYFDAAGKASDHLLNVGDGALAAYLATLGRGVGQEWHDKDAKGGGKLSGGKTKQVSSGRLSADEIDQAVREAAHAG